MATFRPRPVSARFGQFEVDFTCNELRKEGIRVPVQEKPLHLLRLLLESEGQVVNREQLRDALWPADTFVDFEHGVNVAIRKLRQALGDSPDNPRFIETLPKLGYRFIIPVEWIPDTSSTQGIHVVVPVVRSHPRTEEPAPEPPKPLWWKRTATLVVAVCMVVTVLLFPWVWSQIERIWRLNELRQLTVVPVTALPGTVWSPTFSADGNQIAFVWHNEDLAPSTDLYVKEIGNDTSLRLTHGSNGVYTVRPAWSPDGKNIAFCRWAASATDSGIFLISPLGGPERRISSTRCAEEFGHILSWSADGKQLAFLHHPADSTSDDAIGLFLLSLSSSTETQVKTNCNTVQTPAFSPRGDYLAWACDDNLSNVPIYLQRLSDGKVTELMRSMQGVGGLAWSGDGRRIVFSVGFTGGDLWEVALVRPNQPDKLPFGHDAEDVAISLKGRRLAYKQTHQNVNIWRVDLANPQAPAQKIVASSREQAAPDYSPDGTRIAFQSNRSGKFEVWVSDSDGSNPMQLSAFGVLQTGTPRWSPDGKWIAFDSRVGGESNIYLVDPQGGVPKKLDVDVRGNSVPSWSGDGRWIYFVNGQDLRHPSIWKVPSGGGHALQIAKHTTSFPIESPDGQHVYFIRGSELWKVRTDGTDEQKIDGIPPMNYDGWSPSRQGIYFMGEVNGRSGIRFFDLNTKEVKTIFVMDKFGSNWNGGLPVSPDGRWLLFTQADEFSSDLMMVENWH
jgi:Tol biopolymer transport system component/DNA-binding winged helix-turn-helix (wHTH) protein